MPEPEHTDPPVRKLASRGLRHVYDAFFLSMKGLRAALRYESAFRIEVTLALVMLPLAVWLARSPAELALLLFTLLLVLIVELLNSAIETVVDRIGLDYHQLSGRAKDIGSGAVFLSLATVGLVWGLVLLDRLGVLGGAG